MRTAQQALIDAVSHKLAAESGRSPPERLIAALRRVPRAAFVPAELGELATADTALPIGHGQTISQPFIVAFMTEQLQLEGEEKVLEIGTGSGYQAAVLAELAARVFSIERIAALADTAAERLRRLGYHNVTVKAGDGNVGWPDEAPFDAIIVTAAAHEVPAALIAQLAPGGRLVLPVEGESGEQMLTLIRRHIDGGTTRRAVLPVRFVPLLPGERAA